MKNIDILYMLPNYPEPRNDNIINFVKHEYNVGIMFWKKKQNTSLYRNSGCKIIEIPIVANDHNPFRRIIPTLKYFKIALKKINSISPKIIHVSKLDSLLVAVFYKKNKNKTVRIIYDISDMHTLAYNDSRQIIKIIIKKLLWNLEKILSKYVDYILVTSPKFYEEYYKDFYLKKQVVFVPNAPDYDCFADYRTHEGKFTIGFVGSVRYPKQMMNLIDVSENLNINVLIAGDGVDEKLLREYAKDKKNVFFWGKYDYKTEISSIYSSIDCIYSLYDTSIKNVRVALPNKLYEGAWCGIPFIVSKGVYLAELVEQYQLGYAVEDGNKGQLLECIKKIKSESKDFYRRNGKIFSKQNDFEDKCGILLQIYGKLLEDF